MAFSLPVLAFALIAASDPPPPGPGPAGPLARGREWLAAGEPDSALGPILQAHAAGMPKDSLFYFLAEIARRRAALDTALGFNLAVGTPGPGAFRDSVLVQRFRIYAASGLAGDAAALRDSVAIPADGETPPRRHRLSARLGSGWFRESNLPAIAYPFSLDLGGYDPEGWQHRARGAFEFPILAATRIAWTGGLEMQALKSFAKDSVDYRLGASLRAGRDGGGGLSAGIGAEAGRITGSGWVGACKADAGWLSLRPGGLLLIMGGVASEWDGQGRQRFLSAWLTAYRDATSRTGRGFTAMLTFSGFRTDPILESTTHREIYVDDVSRTSPTHYQDGTYADSLPPTGRSAFARYVSAAGTIVTSSRSPQSSLTATPSLGYALPLGGGVIAEANLSASGSWFPAPYRWQRGPLPQGATATGDFRGFARNRADGKEYAVYLIQENGGFREAYASAPLEGKERVRLDGQADAEIGLRRSFRDLGTLAASVNARRYASTMEGDAPIWIPSWYAGAGLRWSGEWGW